MTAATRWGIIGTGLICTDFVSAIRSLDADEHEIVAVAARTLENAQDFGKKFNIQTCYGSYEELSKDPRVEIAYIGIIHMHHAEVSEMMMKAGKHVLCEPALTMNKKQTERVLATARENKVFLMEGFWTSFFPAMIRLREELARGTIGEPRIVTVTFGHKIKVTDWKVDRRLGGGMVLLLGCYCTMLARAVFKNAKLERIAASGTLTDKGVDDFVTATLYFDEGRVAQVTVTMTTGMDNAATIYGSKNKCIKIPGPFWAPIELITPSGTQTFPLPPKSGPTIYPRGEGMVYEVQAVRDSLLKGELENAVVSHDDSLWIVEVQDEIRRQIGLTYDADLE